ncbi:MAG: hypothetical protein COB51_05690 [Moraxellaceae bacterium]|nr:MAG: hypothetical protein COB51_05690 [Moraxellaceae bacterium]
MSVETPEFDQLLLMMQSDPVGFETYRKQLCEDLISAAPEDYQRRLRGIQFQIDMEREKAPTPMASCVKISQMMHESFHKLSGALNELLETEGDAQLISRDIIEDVNKVDGKSAKIVPFQLTTSES